MIKRELTPFFAKELFPSYLEGQLDNSRKEAMEKYLFQDQKARKQFEAWKTEVKFLEELSEISPQPSLIKFIETHRGGIGESMKRFSWSRWSKTSQWAGQLAMVGVLLIIAVHLFPWLNVARSIKNIKQTTPQLKSVKFQEPEAPRTFYGPIWPKELPSPEVYSQKMAVEKQKNAAIADIVAKADEDNNSQATEENEKGVADSGFLWRGVLRIDRLDDDAAEKITQDIVSLGGQKAGQVELGWQKGESRYYHFMIPIENYTALQEKMGEFGRLSLAKEKHPRVMKEGIMRIIMSVEVKK